MKTRLLGVGAALVLAAPPLASAAPVTATVRVEGTSDTVLAATPIVVDDTAGATLTVRDTTDADTATVPAGSAMAQLAVATSGSGLPFGFKVFSFGQQVLRIGAATASETATPFWRFKLNGKVADVGADQVALRTGDSVTWSLVSDWESHELDLTVAGDKVTLGGTVTATVTSVDNNGVASPAAGASVTYGPQTAIADATGTARFATTAPGVQLVQATRSGEVRSQTRSVCVSGTDPTICSLPPATVTKTDTVAPGSQITAPISRRDYRALARIRGTVSPDRSDIAGVEVAIARKVGTRCAFIGPKGYIGRPKACTDRRYLAARTSGTNWVYTPKRPLAKGTYVVWSRATDGAGNVESVAIAGVNVVSFTIGSLRLVVRGAAL